MSKRALVFTILALAATRAPRATAQPPEHTVITAPTENVLLIVMDDVGVDMIGTYAPMADEAPTLPTISGLVDAGVVFEQAWANPMCSPTRAGLYTGRPAYDTGVGSALAEGVEGLDTSVGTLADRLPNHRVGLFGKWHLGDADASGAAWPDKPLAHGFETHRGGLYGEPKDLEPLGDCAGGVETESYFCWDKVVDGVPQGDATETYATLDTANEAIDWVTEVAAAGDPWVAVMAFNAGHSPWDETPDSSCLPAGTATPSTDRETFELMLTCMDDQISRTLEALDALGELQNTTIILVGDNGTDEPVGRDAALTGGGYYPTGHWKKSVYQGGVHVPLIIADGYALANAGPDLRSGGFKLPEAGERVSVPVHTQDIYNTILQIAGESADSSAGVDSVSLAPYLADTATAWLRTSVYTERFQSSGGSRSSCYQAVRNKSYKLVRQPSGASYVNELYKVSTDETESTNLNDGSMTTTERNAYRTLLAALPYTC